MQCYLRWPKPPAPTTKPTDLTALQVKRACKSHPQAVADFRQQIQEVQCSAEQLEYQLQAVWSKCQPSNFALPIATRQRSHVCLKNFWSAKNSLRALSEQTVDDYVLLGSSPANSIPHCFCATNRYLQSLLLSWQSASRFQRLNKALRERSSQARVQKLEQQIEEAIEADRKGLTYLLKCMNMMRPKRPKRTIHIKNKDGRLQSNADELADIQAYFQVVFSSAEPPVLPRWHRQSHLDLTMSEIRSALRGLSSKKALPRGHAPA